MALYPKRPVPESNTSTKPSTPHHWTGFLLFMGPLLSGGGVLAMLRTGDRDLFFCLLIPIGIVTWLIGWWLRSVLTSKL